MPVQFPYPEQGWSTGTMRKAFSNEPWPPRKPPGPGDWRKALEQMPRLPEPDKRSSLDQRMAAKGQFRGNPAEQFRELEGERKKRESKVSQADQSTYETPLTPTQETQFQEWKKKYAPNDSGHDYDLRGAFMAGLTPDSKTGHWPDTFKKPNHPTFSNESIYAKDRPDLAGHWQGDQYIPAGKE